MILEIFSVYDVKARAFGRPFFDQRQELAIRNITQAVRTKDNPLCHFPEDFALYHLGSFDDEHAAFTLLPQPKMIIRCDQLLKETSHV